MEIMLEDTNSIWFEDVKEEISFNNDSLQSIAKYVAGCIKDKSVFEEEFPNELKNDKLPRIVFISVSNGKSKAKVFTGKATGILDAIKQAVTEILNIFNSEEISRIKIDFVDKIYSKSSIQSEIIPGIDTGLYGIAGSKGSKIAFLPEELLYSALINENETFQPDDIINKYIFSSLAKSMNDDRYFFTTIGFFTDNIKIIPLYRGHRMFDQIEPEDLLFSMVQSGKYLTSAIDSRGKFNYIYLPQNDAIPTNYNILRHCGTTYSLLELYELTRDENVLNTAKLAIDYLMNFVKPYLIENIENFETACIVENDIIKLGGNGLALVGLSKYTEITKDDKYLSLMSKLAKWITLVQSKDGSFFIHKQNYSNKMIFNWKSGYYPGESILGLLRLYKLDNNSEWLEASNKAAQYIIENMPVENHDHWLLYALNDLHFFSPKEIYIEHSLKIVDDIINSQINQSNYPDTLGCFNNINTTPAATRVEGLISAYKLCRDNRREDKLSGILNSIELSVKFQMQAQFRAENAMYFDKPELIQGAFYKNLLDFEIRIDYIQHNLSAIIGLYNILISKA